VAFVLMITDPKGSACVGPFETADAAENYGDEIKGPDFEKRGRKFYVYILQAPLRDDVDGA
jgi:hypothetical protein